MERDKGFASLSIVMLLGGLSTIAVAVLHLSAVDAKRAQNSALEIIERTELDGLLSLTVADIVRGRIHLEKVGSAHIVMYGHQAFQRRISDEAIKVQISRTQNSGDPQASDLGLANHQLTKLIDVLDESIAGSPPTLDDLIEGANLLEVADCLRDSVTLFRPSIAAAYSQQAQSRRIADGAVLRIQLERSAESSVPGLDVHVLMTGERNKPYRVMAWRRYRGDEIGRDPCENQ